MATLRPHLVKSNAILPAIAVAAAFLAMTPVKGQTNAPKRTTPPPTLLSPDLQPDGGVTFRYRAPKATSVKVVGQFGPETNLTKAEDGVWSVTVPKATPGVHEYHFAVDGINVIDPQNSWIKPQRWPGSSILHVPSTPLAPWDLQDIPHGVVHEHVYKSAVLGTWRRLMVYTPPGVGPLTRLPVLYLAHGFSDNEGSWTVHGKAHWILDALIASKKAKPMIIVMPDAHALPPNGAFDKYATANTAAFERELATDIIPLVEKNYRVTANRTSRAFAGLSMGGHHALSVALNQHQLFGWIGAFSSAPPPTNSVTAGLAHPEVVNKDLKLFWIACGKKDFLFQQNETFHALLKEKGIRHEYQITEGDHSWPVWRNYLVEFAPKLFR